VTYNQIIERNQEFSNAHRDLNNFGVGGDFDMVLSDQENPYRYNLMWMEDLPSPIETGLESFNFRVYFLGQVTELEHREGDLISTNRNEVISNMRSVAIDFLSYWKQLRSDNNVRFSILTTINVSEDITPDKLYGVNIDVSFKVLQAFNKCIIPMSGIPTPESQDVSIYGNDTLMVTVACGNNYEFEIRNESGDLVGTWNAITKIWTVPDGGGSASIDISLNSNLVFEDQTTNLDIEIVDSTDSPTGNWNGTKFEIDNSTININTVEMVSTPPASIVDLLVKKSDGTTNTGYKVGANWQIGDVTQTVNGASITNNKAETSKAITIRYANNDPVTVTTITDTETVFIGEVPNPLNTSNPFKTGQTTSYVANDDGDLERGNGVSFITLSHNNYFGNTNRFTDVVGGQTYTNNWVIDWSTYNQVTGSYVMWYKVTQTPAAWATVMAAQPYNLGGFTDCYLPNATEIGQLYNFELAQALNYAPFNYTVVGTASNLWTSTTVPTATTTAIAFQGLVVEAARAKTLSIAFIVMRYGNISEL
jgi:hypothetical protein